MQGPDARINNLAPDANPSVAAPKVVVHRLDRIVVASPENSRAKGQQFSRQHSGAMLGEFQAHVASATSVQLCGIKIAHSLDNSRTFQRGDPAASTPDLLKGLAFEGVKSSERIIVFGQVGRLELIFEQQWARTRGARH